MRNVKPTLPPVVGDDMQSGGRRRRWIRLGALVAVVALTALALDVVSSGHRGTSTTAVRVGAPAALGIGPVSSDLFIERGIYLGPPGKIPAGVPTDYVPPTVQSTIALPADDSGTAASQGPEQLAVEGDPADGTATVTAKEARETARENAASFVGPVTIGDAQLVQFDNINAPVVATAWAIPVSGMVQLLAGPPVTSADGSVEPVKSPAPFATTAVIFVDAVTGRFISEEIFGEVGGGESPPDSAATSAGS